MKWREILMKMKWKNSIPIFLLLVFFIIGIFIYDDYGISTDEPQERKTTFVNAKYIMNTFGMEGLTETHDELNNYKDKYYGVFLQLPSIVIEWITGFADDPTIYLYRHLYVFAICTVGYICFYFLCLRLSKSCIMSLLGTFMVALYPRFFANQFYDIKDMLFATMYMISMWITIETITRNLSTRWLIFFGVLTAIATNVRIVGLIFPILMISYILITYVVDKCKINVEEKYKHPFRSIIIILVSYLAVYIAIMPILWKNPIGEIINVFNKFSQFEDWNGSVVFMGEIIKARELPWYYIPVWMLISVPIWYWVLLLTVIIAFCYLIYKGIKNNNKITWIQIFRYKYILWIVALSVGPWFATVIFHSTLYNAWRHCFFLLPPIVLFIVYGLSIIMRKLKLNNLQKIVLASIVIIGLSNQTIWIIKNHPYQMVYLNNIGRIWGDQFDRDYWLLATTDLCRYVLENDDSETISINAYFNTFDRMLNEEEKDRIILEENPTYWIENFRKIIGNDYVREGYEEIYTIVVDGYKIGAVQKKVVQ